MIDTAEQLGAFLPHLEAAEWVAIDTEADSLHAYPEKLCLLQISIAGHDVLVDTLAGINFRLLWPLLARHELILHGADYDLRMLRKAFGFSPGAIFDTMIAARLLGCPQVGLTHLVQDKLGVKLEKSPQKMDWGQRPLPERMAVYARNDTHHLRALSDLLRAELKARGRLGWLEESCARLIEETSRAPEPNPDEVWRIKGSDRLTPRGLAVLRELWHWREAEARASNRPPYFVVSHEHLVAAAAQASEHPHQTAPPPHRLSSRRRTGWAGAVERGLRIPFESQPRRRKVHGHRLTALEQRKFEALREKRDQIARDLGIDATLIASRSEILAAVMNGGTERDTLMRWQQELLFGSH